MWYENPRLYDIAKRITLDAGFDYTDPRTGKTTKAEKAKPATKKAKKVKRKK